MGTKRTRYFPFINIFLSLLSARMSSKKKQDKKPPVKKEEIPEEEDSDDDDNRSSTTVYILGRGRQDNSLSVLTKKFVELIK